MDIDAFGQVLKSNGIRSGSGVPCSYFTPLVNYMYADNELDYVPASSEGEAVAIAAGMVTAGKPAFALMQNSGLGNAVNPITSLLYIYKMPTVLLVSHRGKPGEKDEPQHERMGQITEELIKLCGIEGHYFSDDGFASSLKDVLGRGVPAGWVFPKDCLTGGPKAPPVELHVETSTAATPPRAKYSPEVSREEALRLLLPVLNGKDAPAVVSTTGKMSRELYELDDQDHTKANRFYMVGSMGCAASFSLGIARARQGKVLCLDGDGALLMKLGTLATVGLTKQKNFHHVVLDNGAHESTGGQLTASPGMDTALIALACGYKSAATVCTPDAMLKTLEEQMASDGPTLLRVLVKSGARKDLGRPKLSPRDGYIRFRDWLSRRTAEALGMAAPYQAVILAAGRGDRLSEKTDLTPKSILPIGPRSLADRTETSFLERQVRLLKAAGVDHVVVVIGYLRELMAETIEHWDLGVELVVNPTPEIKTSGSLHSFQFAMRDGKGVLDGTKQTLLLDADIVYHRDVLRGFLKSPERSSLLVCDRYETSQEEVLVYGSLDAPTFLAKGLNVELTGGARCLGEATGIVKFAPEDHALVRKVTDWLLGNPDAAEGTLVHRGFGPARRATEHEELTQHMMRIGKMRGVAFSGDELPFMEVDNPAEYKVLREELYPALLKMEG